MQIALTLYMLLGAQLNGRVEAMGTREPLLAHVEILDGGFASETDAEGRFLLEVPAGVWRVQVGATGHESAVFEETLSADQSLEVLYRLRPNSTAAFETVVRARRVGDPPRVELSRTELREVAGTQGDPLRVVMLLPGVASIASGLSYPVVRGTQPAATQFFIDGVRVPQLYHLLAGPAVVSPELIDRVDFFSGSLPARYGRLLGGAVDAKVAKPSNTLHAVASVDLINTGLFVSAPVEKLGLSVMAAGRVSYTPLIGAPIANAVFASQPGSTVGTLVANFYDYQTRLELDAGPGKLRLFVFGASDEAGQRQNGPNNQTALLRSSFHRADLAWRFSLPNGNGELGVTAGTEQLGLLGERDGVTFGTFRMHRENVALRGRMQTSLGKRFTLELGGEFERQKNGIEIDRDPGVIPGPAASFRRPVSSGALVGLYAELNGRFGNLSATLGLRTDAFFLEPSVSHASADPRLSLRWEAKEWLTVRGGAGLLHQAPTVMVNLPVSDLAGLRDGLQEGAQFELGADARLPSGFEASATLFYVPIFRAIEYSLDDLINNRSRAGEGARAGRSYGLEMMLRKAASGRWFGWLSYTLLRSERFKEVFEFDARGDVTGSERRWVAFDFDQTHVLNLTGGVVLPWEIRLSAGLHFNTGRPESGVLSSRAMQPGVDPLTLTPTWVPVSLARETRLPPFFRIDARVSKRWLFQAFVLEAYLDVLNASFSYETLGYTYGPDSTKTPFAVPVLLPFLGVKASY